MQKKLILLLIFSVFVAVFALHNSIEAEIRLLFWSIRTSMALILILTFAVGAIAGILFSLPGWSKSSKKPDPVPDEEPTEAITSINGNDGNRENPNSQGNSSKQENSGRRNQDPEFEDVSN